jgi:hypothetical protein
MFIFILFFHYHFTFGQREKNGFECKQYENIIEQIKTDKEYKKYFNVRSVRLEIKDSVFITGVDSYLVSDYYAYKLGVTKDEFFSLPEDSIRSYYKEAEDRSKNYTKIRKACLINKDDINPNVSMCFTRIDSNTVQVGLGRKYKRSRHSFGLILIISFKDKEVIKNIIKTTWVE